MDYSQLASSGDRVEIEEVQNLPPTPDIAQTIRRSQRNVNRVDYAKLNSGPLFLTEGSAKVSLHLALHDHEDGDVTMRTVGYCQNYTHRGIKEAIEIYRRNSPINLDEGKK